jgi:uncharacterized protein YndB with AHSA1/START domain
MLTSGRIEIAAPAVDVWAWLIDPVKLTTWLGASGGMPEDPAELHVGWSATNETAAGAVRVEITVFEPPTRLAYHSTYTGGDQLSTYYLTEGDGVTTLTLEGDTDWGRPKGGMEAALDEAMKDQPAATVAAAEGMLDRLEDQLESGAFDSAAQPQLQQAVEANLTRLKTLVEAGEQTAKN